MLIQIRRDELGHLRVRISGPMLEGGHFITDYTALSELQIDDERLGVPLGTEAYRNLRGELEALQEQDRQHQKIIAEVRAALSRVAVYEGLVDVSPTAMMVAQLVQDHEELEARIEAAISAADLAGQDDIVALLRGGPRIPDTPEGL